MSFMERIFYSIFLFIISVAYAQNATECPLDFAKSWPLAFLEGDPCSHEKAKITCVNHDLSTILNYTVTQVNGLNLSEVQLTIICGGYPLTLTPERTFADELRNTGVQEIKLSFQYCDLSSSEPQEENGLIPTEFASLGDKVSSISISCSLISNSIVLPDIAEFTLLKSLTIENNRYYPYGYNDAENNAGTLLSVPYPISFSKAVPCNEFYANSSTNSTDQSCFCSALQSNVSVHCFNILESDLLTVLSNIDAAHFRVVAVNVANVTYNLKDIRKNIAVNRLRMRVFGFLQDKSCPTSIINVTVFGCKLSSPDSSLSANPTRFVLESVENIYSGFCASPNSDTFTFFKYLRRLNFNNNNMTTKDLLRFGGNNVKDIILYGNKLGIIEASTISKVDFNGGVVNLDLRSNGITNIDPDAFNKRERLEVLDLSYNKLSFIDRRWFQGTPKLRVLDLSNNPLVKLPRNVFGYVPSLRILSLNYVGKNRMLESIDPYAFLGLGNLQALNMTSSRLGIQEQVLTPLHSLLYLNLDQSTITGSKVLQPISTLRKLTVSDQALRDEPCLVFGNMPILAAFSFGASPFCSNNSMFGILNSMANDQKLDVSDELCQLTDGSTVPLFQTTTSFEPPEIYSRSTNTSAYNISIIRDLDEPSPPSLDIEAIAKWVAFGFTLIIALVAVVPCCIAFKLDRLYAKRKELTKSTMRKKTPKERKAKMDSQKNPLIKKFFDTTVFNGFQYILNSSWKLEGPFWWIIFLVFTGFTIRDLTTLYLTYIYGDLSTTITLPYKKSFLQRDFTLCTPIEPMNVSLTEDDFNRMFSKSICNPDGFSFSTTIVMRVLLQRVGFQFWLESGFAENQKNHPLLPTFDLIDKHLAKNNVNISTVVRKLSAAMCSIMNFEGISSNWDFTKNVTIFNTENCTALFNDYPEYGITWYDEWSANKMMCVRFPGIFSFTGEANTTYFKFYQYFPSPKSTAMIDLTGFSFPQAIRRSGQVIEFPLYASSKLDLSIENIANLLEQDRAGNTLCYHDCIAALRIQNITATSRCRPLMWPTQSMDYKMPICSIGQAINNSVAVRGQCDGKPQCSRWTFSTNLQPGEQNAGAETVIQWNIQNVVYQQVDQDLGMTSSDFLSNLGGAFGLWIGGTFMGLLHVLSYVAHVLVTILQKKKRTEAWEFVKSGQLALDLREAFSCSKLIHKTSTDHDGVTAYTPNLSKEDLSHPRPRLSTWPNNDDYVTSIQLY